jgi:PAS domain S-box-containing protein
MKFTLEKKIIIAFVFAIIALLLILIIFYTNVQKTKSTIKWVDHTNEVLRKSDNVLIDVLNIETGSRGYVLTGNEIFLESYNYSLSTIYKNISELKELTNDNPQQQKRIDILIKDVKEKVAFNQTINAIKKHSIVTNDGKIDFPNTGKIIADKIRKQLGAINSEEFLLLKQRKTINESSIKKSEISLALLIVFVVILLLLVSLLIVRSQTTRNKLESELKKSVEQFYTFFNSNPYPTFITNVADSKFKFVNNAFLKFFLLQPASVIGKAANEINEFANNQNAKQLIALGATNSKGLEYEITDGNNNTRNVLVSNEVIEIAGENYFITGLIDITDRKELENKLRTYSILESKAAEMEQFAYITSHDLREPLLTIINYIKLLNKNYASALNEDAKQYTNFISKSATRMDVLISGLLDYSRLSRPQQFQNDVDCNEILKDVLADLNLLVVSNNAQINVAQLPVLKAYPLELKLLFQNLIDNAIKFRKKEVAPKIQVSSHKIPNGWQFQITDNGIGIEEKNYIKIFAIFQQLHRRESYNGTGIGLAHCKKIVELHHGKIWVQSTFGESSTFYFTILN